MKRPGLTPLILAATLFLAGGLRAEEAPTPPPAGPPQAKGRPAPPPMQPGGAAEILRRFDKNGDGKLDEDEQAEAHEVMLKEQMGRQAAKEASPDGGQRYRAKMLELFDKNHDGRLDDEERAAARRYAEENGLGAGGVVRQELMKRFDTNADGKLDAAETAALRAFLAERREANAQGATANAAEQARLERVAAEVARRRAEREKAKQAPGEK